MVPARVVEAGLHPHQLFASAQFQHGDHVDGPIADADAVDDPLRPPVPANDAKPPSHGPELDDGDVDIDGPVHHDVLTRRRVVIGVAVVAVVDQAVEASEAVHRERAVVGRHLDADQSVVEGQVLEGDRARQRLRLPLPPSVAGDLAHPCEHDLERLALDAQPYRRRAAGAGFGVQRRERSVHPGASAAYASGQHDLVYAIP